MIKKLIFLSIGLSAFLVACGDNETVTNAPDNAPVEQSGSTNNSVENTSDATEKAFNFTHFELDVQYASNQSYEVSYENEVSGIEAKIEDEVNNRFQQGNEAMNTLTPIFQSFTFDPSSPDDKVIQEVLEKFNLTDNYQEFELEVKFANGTVKEYKRMK